MDRSGLANAMGSTGLRPPRALTLAVTGLCNLKCLHCLVEAGPKATQRHVAADSVRRVVAEHAALGGEEIWITGGEALLHPEWLEILQFCRAQPSFKTVGLQTNGALLRDEHIDALRAVQLEGLSIQVSLDGGRPDTHDHVRGRGTFVKAVDGIRRMAAAGLGEHVSVAFTEMRHNMEDVPALLALVERLGVRRLVAGTLLRDGRAAGCDLEAPTAEQYTSLLARYLSDAGFRRLYEAYGNIAAIEWWKGRAQAGADCCTFVEHPYVTAEGVIYPCALCRADDFAVHGAFEKPLATALVEGIPMWTRLLELKRQRDGSLSPCQGCVGKLHCGGGCMGRAHAATGEFMVVEDRCALRKAVYSWHQTPR
jgi:radical SAM protein with 4Fe4S-binding SPASM domain